MKLRAKVHLLTLFGALLLQMFTFPDWKRHRSSFRYVHHLQTIFESRIVRGLLRPVLVITSCCVGEAHPHSHTPTSACLRSNTTLADRYVVQFL
jgi:hypothetical protein